MRHKDKISHIPENLDAIINDSFLRMLNNCLLCPTYQNQVPKRGNIYHNKSVKVFGNSDLVSQSLQTLASTINNMVALKQKDSEKILNHR